MKKPHGLSCQQCEHYWWYAGYCNSYGGMVANPTNNKCNRFTIKTKSEDAWYDPLPTPEQIEIFARTLAKTCSKNIYK
jgi:hypothetical protein